MATIRPAAATDRDPLTRMFADLWPSEPLAEHARAVDATLAGTESSLPLILFVAVVGGELVGFVEVGLRSHADGCDAAHPVGFLEGWYVKPEHRRRAIGGALVQAAEEWARAQGCREMASDTWLDSDVSQRAHAALGFEVVDRVVNFRKALT